MHTPLLFAFVAVFVPRAGSQCIQNVPTNIADLGLGGATPVLPETNSTVQAIIPQYKFSCSGFVTQWVVAVKMAMPRSMSFQVWRPIGSSSASVYSLVVANTVTGISKLAGTHTFSILVSMASQVLVMSGDVIGYSYGGARGDWKIQVNTTSTQITAFYMTTGGAGMLTNYARITGAPLISAVFQSTVLPSPQISITKSATLSATPATIATSIAPDTTIAQATVVTRTTMTQDAPTQTVLPPPPPPPPLTSHVVVIVVTVTVVLTVFLMSAVSVAFLLLCIRRGRQKRQRLRTVKREEMNQNCTDTTLQKSLLFPLVTKTQDGFLAEMSLSASSIHVESPNHYSAHTSADDCTDDVTGQFYTTATKTGVDAMEEPNIAVGRYEKVETNQYDVTHFLEDKYWFPALTASGLYEQLSAHKYKEIPRSQLRILSALGSGQFGYVRKGFWNVTTEVAVKMLKDGASEEDKIKFLQEAAIMGQFSHPNVVKMYGVVTFDNPPMIVLELMAGGDLHSFLIMPTILQKYGQEQLKKMFLKFSQEIAFGMVYLSRKSFVHRDLAARNILLTNLLTCKIGDFGMARNLINDMYYTTEGGVVPVKWTAPEALLYKKYSSSSDVYSFGMVMYEMWCIGVKPFHDLRNADVPDMISSGYCLAPPPGCPRAIYSCMVDCWHPHYNKRPHFNEVMDYFKKPEELLLYWSPEDQASAGGGADLGSSLSSAEHLFPDLQNRYKESHEHC